jgi:hypothetical protein
LEQEPKEDQDQLDRDGSEVKDGADDKDMILAEGYHINE